MARALSRDVRLIIMDEPSAVLDSGEVSQLFDVVRELTARDVAVVYISHRLVEIREIGDRVTVLKDGKTVATGLDAKDTPTSELIRLMPRWDWVQLRVTWSSPSGPPESSPPSLPPQSRTPVG